MKPRKHDRPYLRPNAAGVFQNTGKHHCRTPNCRHIVNKKREHSPYCSRCRSRRWKNKFPLHYSFKNLRVRAKQRGKDFKLTRAEYIAFAILTPYAEMKGKSSLSLSIDRKDNSKGYEVGNIRCMTLSANTRKQYVPYFARQIENQSYEPTAQEIAAVAAQL